ncbi:HD-GYP domain-containing protein [Halalkalibacter nanhaiisediminis]|nr:HD-GYP domain-containing protein [Halalkalibacter nanhaiisediminis]
METVMTVQESEILEERCKRFVGCKLNRNIYASEGTLLLKKGVILTESLLKRLKMDDDRLEEFVRSIPYTSNEYNKLLTGTVEEIREIFSEIKTNPLAISQVETLILPKVKLLAKEHRLTILLNGMQGKDDYTYRHNIGVAIVASLLAKWLKMTEEEIHLITLGGLLHDIGKLRIDDHILMKPGALTKEEYEHMQMHAIYGYEILTNDGRFSEGICLMALEHHEREDGSGYPDGKTAETVHPYSKIIAIADVFHAMISDRVYRKGFALYDVLKQIKNDAFRKLEPTHVGLFIKRFMEMAIGNYAELNNGLHVEIVFVFEDDPINPLVRFHKELIDLRRSKLYIKKLIDMKND